MSELPVGWETTSIAEVSEQIRYGHTASASDVVIGPKMIRITDIAADGSVDWSSVPYCACDDVSKYSIVEGDILVARTGATTGKSYLVSNPPEETVFASYLIRLRCHRRASAVFLARFMRGRDYWRQITTVSKGTAQPGANATILGGVRLPFPPINEQKRIVAKIDALTEKSRRAREALEEVPKLLEKLRKSILAAAFRGDLTKEWRKQNPNVEPAEKLLERIRTERRSRWEQAELEKMRAKGKEPKNDKWKAKYKEPKPVDTEGLPELPLGWCWASVDELAAETKIGLVRNSRQQSTACEAGVPYIRMQHYDQYGRWNESNITTVHVSDDELRTYSLEYGDVLFNTRNSPELVGKVAVWSKREQYVYNNNLMRIRFSSPVRSFFAGLQMSGPVFQSHICQHKSATTSIAAIYLRGILGAPVAVAPEREQDQILGTLLRALESADAVATRIKPQLVRVGAVDRSILAKAFRGELVPQDPNDEPASVLLERIRAEREAEAPKKKRRSTKKKSAKSKTKA